MQQGDSALTDIHLSDPSERHVDGNADEDGGGEWEGLNSCRVKETVVTSECSNSLQEEHYDRLLFNTQQIKKRKAWRQRGKSEQEQLHYKSTQ